MDYIRKFDIELEREHYYAGEKLKGWVVLENTENLKVRGIRVMLRGKAHVEWKVTRSGERRSVKEDQYFIDDKAIVWGKDKKDEMSIPILPRATHRFPFEFFLSESRLPCSFESRIGTVRYYLRVFIDIPYASPPQGLKYFTLIGPHIDCMDERYTEVQVQEEQWRSCCLCCMKGPVSVKATLDRSAYCCGENIKLKAQVQNASDQSAWLVCRLVQNVEFRINKGVLGLSKELSHCIWEYRSPTVSPHQCVDFTDLQKHLKVPCTPPTVADVCKLLDIYYILKVNLWLEKSGRMLDMDFAVDIATVPFRIPNGEPPHITYKVASEQVEGGMYISPEFQLGQVYDGTFDMPNQDEEDIILYRPVYVCVPSTATNETNNHTAAADNDVKGDGGRERGENNLPGTASSSQEDLSTPLTRELTSEKCTSV